MPSRGAIEFKRRSQREKQEPENLFHTLISSWVNAAQKLISQCLENQFHFCFQYENFTYGIWREIYSFAAT